MATYRPGYTPKPNRNNTPPMPSGPSSSSDPMPRGMRSGSSMSASERELVNAAAKSIPQAETGNFSSGDPDGGAPAYPVYKKGSAQANDFNSAFGSARKAGLSEFEWEGRKYNTKKK